jgi:agmatine deiminase
MKTWELSDDPRDFGYFMPGEWTDHKCCWMAWPCRKGLWANDQKTMQEYANVANAIAKFELLKMLVPADKIDDAKQLLDHGVEIIETVIDDSWARDSGPNFLVGGDKLAGSDWIFNAWGEKYDPYDQDAQMAARILERADADRFPSQLVAEGGGITVDGEGTIITTESCFLNKNRNPTKSKLEIEKELCRTLGGTKVIWIPGDIGETETDGHIDGIAAFIEPGRVLVEINSDKTDEHYQVSMDNLNALRNIRDAKGRVLEIETIHEGDYSQLISDACRSYVNSYIANGAVIVPGYNHQRDEWAVETYKRIYPDRTIVQVQISEIASGGGGIHCITQQQPTCI